MQKIIRLIDKLNYDELDELRKNLKERAVIEAIEKKLETFKNSNRVCPVCNTPIGEEGLILIFGPTDFRKKAEFDASDCLEYFVSKLKK